MYDAVIVGSGYGGAVMAARLAPHGRVLLVERGRRWASGDFPTGLPGLLAVTLRKGNPLGLWSMRFGAGTGNALVNGLGGASLVNYGITTRPDDHVFEGWPINAADLDPYFARARQVLRPSFNPIADELGDKAFLDAMEPGRRVDLENTIDWPRCTQCGDCLPGCNVDAKLSLDRTYVALAERQGADIETVTEAVQCGARSDGRWELVLRRSDRTDTDVRTVITRQLVLSMGTFGTLDFLHKHHGSLPTTAAFGQHMGMNGDSVAFLYNTSHPLSGHHGAPISTSVRVPFVDAEGRTRTLMIMAGRLPGMLMRPAGALLGLLAGAVQGERLGPEGDAWSVRVVRRLRDLVLLGGDSGLERTFMYKLDAEDSTRGQASFDDKGQSAIDWPDYADDPILRFAAERLEQWGRKVGGTVVRNLGGWPGMRSFGVHPLGGCRMGATADQGVVDSHGRLFRPDGTVYPGLRIVDASVLPASPGVPPSFTLAAIAERAAEHAVSEMKRTRDQKA